MRRAWLDRCLFCEGLLSEELSHQPLNDCSVCGVGLSQTSSVTSTKKGHSVNRVPFKLMLRISLRVTEPELPSQHVYSSAGSLLESCRALDVLPRS